MTTLLLGGSGQLGSAFRSLLPDAVAPTRVELDLADLDGIAQNVTDLSPTRIINCAAYTAVDEAEDDEETARLINGDAVGRLARVAEELGVPFVTFSYRLRVRWRQRRWLHRVERSQPAECVRKVQARGRASGVAPPGHAGGAYVLAAVRHPPQLRANDPQPGHCRHR